MVRKDGRLGYVTLSNIYLQRDLLQTIIQKIYAGNGKLKSGGEYIAFLYYAYASFPRAQKGRVGPHR
jgi:hypothetical protein